MKMTWPDGLRITRINRPIQFSRRVDDRDQIVSSVIDGDYFFNDNQPAPILPGGIWPGVEVEVTDRAWRAWTWHRFGITLIATWKNKKGQI